MLRNFLLFAFVQNITRLSLMTTINRRDTMLCPRGMKQWARCYINIMFFVLLSVTQQPVCISCFSGFSNANLIISSIWGHTWPELKKSIRKPKTERYKTKTNWPVPSSHWKWAKRKLEVPQVRRQGQAAKKKKKPFPCQRHIFRPPSWSLAPTGRGSGKV